MTDISKKCSECGQNLKKYLKCGQEFKNNTQNPDDPDKRWWIGFVFCAFSAALLFVLLYCYQNVVIYDTINYKNVPQIIGRILFSLNFFLFGVGIRAFVWYYAAKQRNIRYRKANPWKEYVLQYALFLGIVSSVFIFSVITVTIDSLPPNYIFYLMSSSVSIVAGFKGYALLDGIKASQ